MSAILKFKPDIVHCVEHTPCSTFCGALAAFFHIPTVWSSHTNLDYYLPLYIHPLTASASVAPSVAARSQGDEARCATDSERSASQPRVGASGGGGAR